MRPLLALRRWRAPRCPYCRESVERDQPSARCDGCETLIHAACADELGGCSTLGCVGRRARPTPASQAQPTKGGLTATTVATQLAGITTQRAGIDELAQLAVRLGAFGTVILLPVVVVCLIVTLGSGGWATLRLLLESLPELLAGELGWALCLLMFPAALLAGLTVRLARSRRMADRGGP